MQCNIHLIMEMEDTGIYDSIDVTRGTMVENGDKSATSANSSTSNPGYKSLIKQNVTFEYAKINRYKKKKTCLKACVLCCFVLLSNVLSLAAVIFATVNFVRMTEYKGQMEDMIQNCTCMCDTFINCTGGT